MNLEALFELEAPAKEEVKVEPTKKNRKTETAKEEENGVKGDSIEPKTESTDPTRSEEVSTNQHEPRVDPEGWHPDVIGKPKGRPQPYFRGVVTQEGTNGRQILVPFDQITHAQRQVYVDDIHLTNPTVYQIIYRLQGSFPDVLVRVTEDVFNEVLASPHMKLKKVNYSWVSDHVNPRRNYLIQHPERPTSEEIQKIDKHIDEIEWALKPWHEKESLKKDAKYKNMPKEEELPLPVAEEEDPVTDAEEFEQPEE